VVYLEKIYEIEFLYDNGIYEQCFTNEITEEDLNEVINYIKDILKNDLKGTISFKNKYGRIVHINVAKITTFKVLD
jgi:formamidopyrimidine-DNA glycosylase